MIARLTQCNTCGSTDVKWRELDEGWRMFDTNRRGIRNELLLHNCLHAAASIDEFESA